MGTKCSFIGKKFILPSFEFKPGSHFPRYVNPNQMHLDLRNYLGENDVVLSDIYSSLAIPVYTGAKIIALWHTPPQVNDNFERIQAVETFFDPATSYEERRKIIQYYGVTHVFLNYYLSGKDLEPLLKQKGFVVVAREKNYCLFSVVIAKQNSRS